MQETIEITSILKDFYAVSGIRISIHDTEFNEIYSYPKEPSHFCRCIQQNKLVHKDCVNNDSAAFARVKSTGRVYVYKCRRGLYEAVAPLYHFGTLSGYLMMGQFCDNSPEATEYVINKATEILGNREEAAEISKTVNRIDRKLIDSYINIMTVLAEYLTETNKVVSHNEKLPRLIKEYINKNYSGRVTLSVLAQKFGCCNATLTKSFKNEYGCTIMSYLTEVRLNKAEQMILKTRNSIKEIAAECGFYDQNYFSKSFARKFGVAPTEYREKFFGLEQH